MKKLSLMIPLIAVLLLFSNFSSSSASPPDIAGSGAPDEAGKPHDLPHPLGEQKRALRREALRAKLQGKATGRTHEVARGQFVELEREGEDQIWTVLGEFSDFPHNNIAKPDRNVDNTTYWEPDFNREHYRELLFSDEPGANSMRNFYIEQSSNRYAVDGDVTEWIQVPGVARDYGVAFRDTWYFLEDSVDGWYEKQLAAGKSPEEINDYLSQFDVWDRYDWDGDGNFDEPDGYIDHFQAIHSGQGEEAGGGALGSDAIWSHRWYAFYNLIGQAGPSSEYQLGGIRVGNSDYWIGDYTIEPENGGVGVFAHEFAHDLDLPDLYDTAGGENGTGFWTLMSSGSWTTGSPDYIGTRPTHMGAWEKFQLGWLNYDVAYAGETSSHRLGPAETNTRQAQGLFVLLPDKEVTTHIADPYAGERFYYSGSGNDLDNVMYRQVDLAAGSTLTAQVNYDIELDWDYAYLVVSTDGGETWQSVATNQSTSDDPNGQNFGHGITGESDGWVSLTADLSGYTGNVLIGFRYWTDGYVTEPGFMVDEITVTGYPTAGAEGDDAWTLDGFRVTDGLESQSYFNAYVAEYRQYRDYDDALRTGPYNFGFMDNPERRNWVEHFPYQDGLLISYWDASQTNNNTSRHPGEGLILPIDAHPGAMYRADGGVWRNRVQTYDATFGLEPTEGVTLHWLSEPSEHPSKPAAPVFADTRLHWDAENPMGSVKHPNTGTAIEVRSVDTQDNFMQVLVRPAR